MQRRALSGRRSSLEDRPSHLTLYWMLGGVRQDWDRACSHCTRASVEQAYE